MICKNGINKYLFFLILGISIINAGAIEKKTPVFFYSDTSTEIYHWEALLSQPKDSLKIFSKEAAINGEYGLSLSKEIEGTATLFSEMPFLTEFWLRYYIRVDRNSEKKLHSIFFMPILSLNFFEKLQSDQPASTIETIWFTTEKSNIFKLQCRLRPTADSAKNLLFDTPIITQRAYCIEKQVKFIGKDSIGLTFYLDGKEMWRTGCRYPYKKSFIGSKIWADYGSWHYGEIKIDFDDIVFSTSRLFPKPIRPIAKRALINGFVATVGCSTEIDKYFLTDIKSARFILHNQSNVYRPIYDITILDPRQINNFTLPFELDSGKYFYKTAIKNKFNNWSDYSDISEFTVNIQRELPIRIGVPFVTMKGHKSPISHIGHEQWYDLHIPFTNSIPATSKGGFTGYLIAWLHHESYTEGNITNKGGVFLPDKNYVFNISSKTLLTQEEIAVFEKVNVGSSKSTKISLNNFNGLYTSLQEGLPKIDTVNNEIIIRFKLLKEATLGNWFIAAVFNLYKKNDYNGQTSNLTTAKIVVENKIGSLRPKIVFITLASILAIIAIIFIVKRKIYRDLEISKPVIDNQLTSYIESHITEKITTQSAIKALGLTENYFRRMLKEYNIKLFPEFVNRLKIEKAKQLLATTEKNISQIGFYLGYDNINYFIKTFKKIVGCTPGEYRNNLK